MGRAHSRVRRTARRGGDRVDSRARRQWELERLASQGHFTPPTLAQLEEVLDRAVGLGPAAVAADLWDIDRLEACAACRARRVERLRRVNATGQREPRVTCAVCGAS